MADLTKQELKETMISMLSHNYGVTPEEATDEQIYKILATILRDECRKNRRAFEKKSKAAGQKQIYYLSMEFLMGRSLKNTLYNLSLTETAGEVLSEFGVNLEKLYELEPDAGLGNGGLGRLAACYLDALANDGYHGMGYSILYEYGIFKQKIIDGWQTEMPDFWLPGGEAWLIAREDKAVEVKFEGRVEDSWGDGFHYVDLVDCKTVKAVPYDMMVPSKDGENVAVLRLWSAKADAINMSAFNQGNYAAAMEEKAMAEVISKVLYPSDNHQEGKSLRLRQQYFLVSASIQDIISKHLSVYGNLDNFAEKNAVHINDTHPTMVIPELMRIFLDECGFGWDKAFDIVSKCCAYTNHTVMSEALECWSEELFSRLLPRVYQIVKEIDNRFRKQIWDATGDAGRVERMAVISGGMVKMANLCVAVCHKVNGVSALHSNILKESLFKEYYDLMPDKFTNVTNGIAHRRWLCQANPRLTEFLTGLIGGGFVHDASELSHLRDFSDDKSVLSSLSDIKKANKTDFAKTVLRKTGIAVDPESVFDVQVKRLHEYKRQSLNVLNILAHYLEIKANPNGNYVPRTYIFGAKAASGYYMAKKTIELIFAVAGVINNDPAVKDLLKVVYLEDYNVSMAEALMPSADFSEQISLAGTEASGTGNMKLMINGAVTVGTMDGANVEIYENVGKDNIIIFGMSTSEVSEMKKGGYCPMNYYQNNAEIRAVIDFINRGIGGKNFGEITSSLLYSDTYMALADFADYRIAKKKTDALWLDREKLSRMSLHNIAGAGFFAADRSINDYAVKIWNADTLK
ncbi:MAG: glycogen/starch/alpha-glucan phosphorylase [Clostridiales bacterium]|nr:glycogen/starch/alpha-glucan phosphorylase [Clostridiales bacterium]